MKRPTILLRIVSTCLLPGLVIVAGFSGCRGEPVEARDPALYALDIKAHVIEFLNDAKANPQNAAENVEALLETLEVYHEGPVGGYGQVYANLLIGCRELKRMYEQSAGAAETNAKIDELLALAGKLPGELELEEKGAPEEEALQQ